MRSVATSTAEQLRQAFDASFAEPLRADAEPPDDFLAIQVDADPHALRLADVASVLLLDAVTPLPSPLPELLGVIGFRGGLLPLYDLRAVLGYAGQRPARWAVVAAAAPLALAFDSFDGHLRVPRGAARPAADPSAARRHVQEILQGPGQHAGQVRPVVALASVLDTLTAAARRCAAGTA